MSDINNQYDFFKNVVLDEDGAMKVSFQDSATIFSQTATNYTDLLTKVGMATGDLAYVYNSEGTKWLPTTLGGTYYPSGIYVYNGAAWVSDRNGIALQLQESKLDNRIVVTQDNVESTLGGVIDSSKQYFLDGIIDLGSTQITVPPTGMTIVGLSFDLSGLTSSEDNYTMFISESIVIGSGNLLGADYLITVDGANSKVYELYDATGFNAFEFTRINYIDCTSLGDIYDYRQGLELGTGRFGGSPSLTLHGLWRGGYRITTSIVRSLAGTMTEPLFKEGTLFQMNSRFLTDINCDLPTLAPFCDFQVSNFPNPSTVQIKGGIFSRDGAFDVSDSNIFPNLDRGDLPCDWDNNIGISNTFVGAEMTNTSDTITTINSQNTFEDLAGSWSISGEEHFDSPSSGRLRHLGINPKEFTISWSFVMDGKNNDNYDIAILRQNGGAGVPDVLATQVRVINNLQGGRDVGYWVGKKNIVMNQNDEVFFQVANLSDNDNITLESDSSFFIEER